jgi:hypothetical protein
MAEKFDPARTDKHAEAKKDRRTDKAGDELEKLKDSFPASDPAKPATDGK